MYNLLFRGKAKTFEILENISRISKTFPSFHKGILKMLIFKIVRPYSRTPNFWKYIDLKYFLSRGFLKIHGNEVFFNYKGVCAHMPLKWLYELTSMLDIFERLSKFGRIYSLDSQNFIVEIQSAEMNVKFLLPFPYSPHALYQTYIKRPFNEEDLNGKIVIDIGAYIGDTGVYFAKKGATVYAFEPFPTSYSIAQRNLIINKVTSNVKLYRVAISSHSGKIKLRFNPDMFNVEGFGTFFSGSKEITVECWSLRDLLEKFELNNVEILKMDCEGCEFEIIPHSTDILSRFNKIILEYHIRENMKNGNHLKYLLKHLKLAGFHVKIKNNYIYATKKS
jgi:FkbM family methyltransferase